MQKLKTVQICSALATACVNFTLCSFMGSFSIVKWMWLGFIPMIIYFSIGTHKDFTVYLKMFCSFLCGLFWGQISNLLYINFLTVNSFVVSLIDNILLLFLIVWIHIGLLGHTVVGFLPTVFLGFAETVGFWGRPCPLAGNGIMGTLPTFYGLGILIILFIFGLLYAFCVELLGDFFASHLVSSDSIPEEPPAKH